MPLFDFGIPLALQCACSPKERDPMASSCQNSSFDVQLEACGSGVWRAPGARIIDRAGQRRLPIGDDGFERAVEGSLLVDKTMLMADVLDSGYTATLFCRPRRFGKTLNMTMMKAFFEIPTDGKSRAGLFEGTEIWEAEGGRYRSHQGAYPVVFVNFNTVKKDTWGASLGEIRDLIATEYERHAYLSESPRLSDDERNYFDRICSGSASDADIAASLRRLCLLLYKHHGRRVVLLVDEYDAPVMAAYSAPNGGYYEEVVSFLKGWLTGAIKDGGAALAFACLTGVQRISKESIFSDLNNLVVSTPLDTEFDERFGFSDAEVAALAVYLDCPDCMDEARQWYDGYRFGEAEVYNPWSILNYLKRGCAPDVYWGNTSSNTVVGDLVRHADARTMRDVYALMEPGGIVYAPLDLSIVFPDVGVREGAIWSMLYLAGYLTTDMTAMPNNNRAPRPLRIPNREIALLYQSEIVERFAGFAGGSDRLYDLHAALVAGDAGTVAAELGRIVRDSASCFDLGSENGCHMLLLGLCFGMLGYGDPSSNREAGRGRPDIQIAPESSPFTQAPRPFITIEVKFLKGEDCGEEALAAAAEEGLAQIEERGYDEGPLPAEASGRLRWGIAFGGRKVAAACEWTDREGERTS